MEYLTFFKICENYYYLLPSDYIKEGGEESISYKKRLFREALFSKLSDNQTILATELSQILGGEVPLKSDNYLLVRDDRKDDYFLLTGLGKDALQSSFFSRADPKIRIANKAKEYGKLAIYDFRLKKRQELLNRLLSKKTVLEDCMQAFADYSFFDKWVLWTYNRHTQVFTSIVSSHHLPKEYVTRKDDSSLHAFLDSNMPSDQRPPNKSCVNEEFAQKMRWLNRIRLRLGDHPQDMGIIDFLSEYPHFKLRSDTQKWIKNCLETKYSEHLRNSQAALYLIQEHFTIYRPGGLEEFLCELTKRICDGLCFQACSIFKKHSKKNKLEMVAVTDMDQHGKPEKQVAYDLSETTFTGSVFNNDDDWDWSYDLANDPRNSHTYDETTEGAGKTWIAINLVSKIGVEKVKWGLLRVKNKHVSGDKMKLINFTPDDVEELKSICIQLASLFNIEQQHIEYGKKTLWLRHKLTETENASRNLKNFYKVFLHEIRTPISPFNTSALRFSRLLHKLPLQKEEKLPLDRKLRDIYVIGQRLAFIADTYYFHELVKPRQCEYLFVMKDIVMPVYNISRDYFKKQPGIDILLNENTLLNRKVYGEKNLLGIVFNALISNAAKYTLNPAIPITVDGNLNSNGRHFNLNVSNFGLRIHEDEKEKIFMDGERGKEAILYKSQGTGIGLYLSRSIMKSLKGELILKKTFNPVIFTICIPTFKWLGPKGGQDV